MIKTMQLSMNLGAMSGVEKVEPFAVGDVIVKARGNRYVITHTDSNDSGGVFCCISLDSGAEAVVLEREIAYRSR